MKGRFFALQKSQRTHTSMRVVDRLKLWMATVDFWSMMANSWLKSGCGLHQQKLGARRVESAFNLPWAHSNYALVCCNRASFRASDSVNFCGICFGLEKLGQLLRSTDRCRCTRLFNYRFKAVEAGTPMAVCFWPSSQVETSYPTCMCRAAQWRPYWDCGCRENEFHFLVNSSESFFSFGLFCE